MRGHDSLGYLAPELVLSFEHLSEITRPTGTVYARLLSPPGLSFGPYEIDFRTMIGPKVRWISARGRGSDEDIIRRVMTGVSFLDVTGRKLAEESSELLAGEMQPPGSRTCC